MFFIGVAGPETLSAFQTLERFFSRVRSLVSFKAAPLTENPPAHITGERLLALVNRKLVFTEAAFYGKGLSTLRAAKLLDARVNNLVYFELSRRAKGLLTMCTAVQLLSGMFRPLVQLHSALYREFLPTQYATERFPICGYDLVRPDVTLLQKKLAAMCAAESLLSFARGPLACIRTALGAEDPPAPRATGRFPPAPRLPPSNRFLRPFLFFHFRAVLVINKDSGSGSSTQLHCICQ